jgi:hypothetical protein
MIFLGKNDFALSGLEREGASFISQALPCANDYGLSALVRTRFYTVSSSARKRINNVFDYVRGDGARTVSTTAMGFIPRKRVLGQGIAGQARNDVLIRRFRASA